LTANLRVSVMLAAAIGTLAAAARHAGAQQTSPAVPPAFLPDIRLQRLAPPEAPQPAPEIIPPPPPAAAPAGGVRFVLAGVAFDGVTVYPATALDALVAPLLGTAVTLADLSQLAKELERRYRGDGYFLTRVIVPAQTVEDGRIRIRVLEGSVATVTLEGEVGEVGGVAALIRDYLEPVTRERPLRFATLERALLLANDIPGVSVAGVLRPAPRGEGAAELVVTATRKAFAAAATTDNFGDDFTGRYQMAASLASNAWTRFGEQLSIVGFVTDPWSDHRQLVGQATSSWRIGGSGLVLETLYAYGDSRPGSTVRDLDVESTTQLVGAYASYPVVRSRSLSLTARLGFEALDSRVDVLGERFSRDRLRVVTAGGTAALRDPLNGTNELGVALRQGLPVLNASRRADDDTSRPDGTAEATVLQATGSRLQPLGGPFSLFLAAAGQYAFTGLLADEEFELGGSAFGRGYDFAEVSGDSGIGGSAELRYTWATPATWLERLQLFGFFDGGRVWDREPVTGDTLTSAGAGLRLFPLAALFFELAVAKPLSPGSERANGQHDPQFLFRAVGRL
jgi:hemolysin activation/secretion protein